MLTSNSTSADPNSIGLFIELDAILAVVIGGTSLAGGRFSLAGTLIGAFIIETMDAFVVIAISAAQHRRVQGLRGHRRLPAAVAAGQGLAAERAALGPPADQPHGSHPPPPATHDPQIAVDHRQWPGRRHHRRSATHGRLQP